MLCGVKDGSWNRRAGDPGQTPVDSADRNSQRPLCSTGQSSPSCSSCVDRIQFPASPTRIIFRLHSFYRRFRFFSRGYFISLVCGNGKRTSEILRIRGIESAIEKSQLEETEMKDCVRDSAAKTYSVSPSDYRLLEEVGKGASATVYRAMYLPYNEIVAVKCVDLDRCNINLDDIRREAQTMSLTCHPNVVKGYCSFVVERYLWFVMPFMAEVSCFHLMKVAYPDGFEEHVIGSILKGTLKALEYFHKHGHIHRDVKAENILLDSSGVVKLRDFGVTACMFDKGDRQHARQSWMAPEVMQPGGGYDFKTDIWSFGITALELAHGHTPSKYTRMKFLLMTLQNSSSGLDYDRDKKFSKSFKEMVAMCLVKDQTKRPTAEALLKHIFFKNAKTPEFSMKSLLANLPPLWDRVKALQIKDAEQLTLKKISSSEQEALSQTEYQRGVNACTFDIEDLKVQTSLILDDEDIAGTEEDGSLRNFTNNKILDDEEIANTEEDGGSLRNFINKFEQELPTSRSTLEKPLAADDTSDRDEGENQLPFERCSSACKALNLSGPLMLPNHASANSLSAPTQFSRGYGDYAKYMHRENAVQIKGRFSVESVNADIVKPVNHLPKENIDISLPASILVPHLQNIFQRTSFQQDLLKNLLKTMQENDLVSAFQTETPSHTFKLENDVLVKAAITEREYHLLLKISELHARITRLTDELTAERLKHTQLRQEMNAAYLKKMEKISDL